jgi:hypothetical protein
LGVTITFWHCTKVIGMIFDLETTINHAGFAVHHNFSIMAISLICSAVRFVTPFLAITLRLSLPFPVIMGC